MFLLLSPGKYLCWWTIYVLLLSLGKYLCWWIIYVFITIAGPIPLLVDNLYFIIITGPIPLLLDYLCFYYHHWVNTSAGGLSMFLLLSLGQYLCRSTIYVFFTITGPISLLVDNICFYYYHWVNTSAGGLSMFLLQQGFLHSDHVMKNYIANESTLLSPIITYLVQIKEFLYDQYDRK